MGLVNRRHLAGDVLAQVGDTVPQQLRWRWRMGPWPGQARASGGRCRKLRAKKASSGLSGRCEGPAVGAATRRVVVLLGQVAAMLIGAAGLRLASCT